METALTIKLKNELKEVEKLGDIINEWTSSLNLAPSSVFEISIVFDEIVANIIKHGYSDKTEHYIDIALNINEYIFTATIEDEGIDFNPLDSVKDDRTLLLKDRDLGGRGIHIIKKYMDLVDYQRKGNKNILTINRKIKFIKDNID